MKYKKNKKQKTKNQKNPKKKTKNKKTKKQNKTNTTLSEQYQNLIENSRNIGKISSVYILQFAIAFSK